MVTLFSLIHGDMMRENFDMLHGSSYFIRILARFFLYSYVLLFICGILNIFLTIMQDAYHSLMESLKHAGGESIIIQKRMEEEKDQNNASDSSLLKFRLIEFDSLNEQDVVPTIDDNKIDSKLHIIDILCDSVINKIENEGLHDVSNAMVEDLRQSARNALLSTLQAE
jgi:hypothetical protein